MAPAIKNELFSHMRKSTEIRTPAASASPETRSSLDRQGAGRRRLESACSLKVDRIIPDPDQPRTEFDQVDLDRLAGSLKDRGQLQPIRVRWSDSADRYIVVVGERRWRAAQIAGLETLDCIVVTGQASPDDLLEDQLIENCLRAELKPIEQAKAYKRLLTSRNLTYRDLAERLRIAPGTVSRAMSLLELPEAVQERVEEGTISPDTAYELSRIADPVEQAQISEEVVSGRMTRDDIREVGKRSASKPRAKASTGKVKATRVPAIKPLKPRIVRLPTGGKFTIEPPKKATDRATFLAMAEELVTILRAEQGGASEAA